MTQKSLDLLSLYAELDIIYPTTGTGASMHQAMSCFFDKAENTLTYLQARRDTANKQKFGSVPTYDT